MGFDVEVVRHPKARRYVLRVRDDGTVRVTVPRWGSKRHAEEFVEQQRQWIERERQRVLALREEVQPLYSPEEIARLRASARVQLPDELQRLAGVHGLTVSRVSVRNQRWRWGSCSPKGHICLNWRLVLMPGHVREYVLIHELMHLKRLDHSRAFWRLVASACPDYQAARRWLRTEGRSAYRIHPISG